MIRFSFIRTANFTAAVVMAAVAVAVWLLPAASAPAQTIEALMRATQERHMALEYRRQVVHELFAELIRDVLDGADSDFINWTVLDLLGEDDTVPDLPVWSPPISDDYPTYEDYLVAKDAYYSSFAESLNNVTEDFLAALEAFNSRMTQRAGSIRAYRFFVNDWWLASRSPHTAIAYGVEVLGPWVHQEKEWFRKAGAPVDL